MRLRPAMYGKEQTVKGDLQNVALKGLLYNS